jgi:hypothetical protein
VGCPRQWRLALFLAFLAKAVWDMPTTRALLDRLAHDPTLRRLCGWDRAGAVPSEATFSRAFAEFARAGLPQQLHGAILQAGLNAKLMGHASHDATAIEAREKPARKAKAKLKPKPRRGRLKKGQTRAPKPLKRLAVQPSRSLARNLADLPTACDCGAKTGSKGARKCWVGYKLHLSTVDGDIPVAAILTSASMHDSQAIVPLMQMTAERVTTLYDLADSAYDAPAIHAFSRSLGHVPVIDPAGRGKQAEPPVPLAPARKVRYRERTASERVNSDLLDNHGGRHVRVRGAEKVAAHLLLGVLVVAAKGLMRLMT